jgi:hypothetical protein
MEVNGQIPARDYKAAFRSIARLAGFKFVMSPQTWKQSIPLVLALLAAAALKGGLLLAGAIPFNSDEAVVALMARHILLGERPLFFYGQAYMGSLDAWLVAGAFRLVGESVLSVRIVQAAIYALYVVSVWLLARDLFSDHRAAPLAAGLAAVPTVLVTTYTTASLGGYGEVLLLGNLILWLGYRIAWGGWQRRWAAWLSFGLLSGLAFWTLALSLVFTVPAGVCILLRRRKSGLRFWLLALVGILIGSLPWWSANFMNGWAALIELLNARGGATTPGEHLIALLLLGLPAVMGVRFPWTPDFIPLPVLFASLMFYLSALLYVLAAVRKGSLPLAPGAGVLLGLFTVFYLFGFIFTRFGIDASGRYLLPLSVLLLLVSAAFICAAWRWRRFAGIGLLVLVLSINLSATFQAAASPDLITTQFDPVTRFDNQHDQDLMQFLRKVGARRGYTNYWVSFRLAFLSDEELIFAARLPYKSDLSYAPGDDRYPVYSTLADESSRVAIITSQQPELDERLRQALSSLGIDFNEQQIGVYRVFYNLSQPLRPEQLRLWERVP